MGYSVIYLQPRDVTFVHCEACGSTHPREETNCVASKDPYKNAGGIEPYEMGVHCVHW